MYTLIHKDSLTYMTQTCIRSAVTTDSVRKSGGQTYKTWNCRSLVSNERNPIIWNYEIVFLPVPCILHSSPSHCKVQIRIDAKVPLGFLDLCVIVFKILRFITGLVSTIPTCCLLWHIVVHHRPSFHWGTLLTYFRLSPHFQVRQSSMMFSTDINSVISHVNSNSNN